MSVLKFLWSINIYRKQTGTSCKADEKSTFTSHTEVSWYAHGSWSGKHFLGNWGQSPSKYLFFFNADLIHVTQPWSLSSCWLRQLSLICNLHESGLGRSLQGILLFDSICTVRLDLGLHHQLQWFLHCCIIGYVAAVRKNIIVKKLQTLIILTRFIVCSENFLKHLGCHWYWSPGSQTHPTPFLYIPLSHPHK